MPEPEHLEIESKRRPLHFSFLSSLGQGSKLETRSVRAREPPSYTMYSPPVILSRPTQTTTDRLRGSGETEELRLTIWELSRDHEAPELSAASTVAVRKR